MSSCSSTVEVIAHVGPPAAACTAPGGGGRKSSLLHHKRSTDLCRFTLKRDKQEECIGKKNIC